MATLTAMMVMERSKRVTRVPELAYVRTLNLWGMGIADVSYLSDMRCLQVLSLSCNQITSLRVFAALGELRELYLRSNRIHEVGELQHLQSLPHLRVLTLHENPLAGKPGYRAFVLRCLPHLRSLDDVEVTDREAGDAKRLGIAYHQEEAIHGPLHHHLHQGSSQKAPEGTRKEDVLETGEQKHQLGEHGAGGKRGAAADQLPSWLSSAKVEYAPAKPPPDVHPALPEDKARASGKLEGISSPVHWPIKWSASQTEMQDVNQAIREAGVSAAPGGITNTNTATSSLYTLMALMRELDPMALRIVANEANCLMERLHRGHDS